MLSDIVGNCVNSICENDAVVANEPLNLPSTLTKPEPLTDNIGTPDMSDAANTVPIRSSVTENNWPCDPLISKIVLPDPDTVN